MIKRTWPFYNSFFSLLYFLLLSFYTYIANYSNYHDIPIPARSCQSCRLLNSFYKCLKSAELVRHGGFRNRLGDDQRELAFWAQWREPRSEKVVESLLIIFCKCFSAPKKYGLSSPRAESARAFTGRRCPHSGRGEDFLTGQPNFFTETAVTPERKVEKSFPRWEINRHAKG